MSTLLSRHPPLRLHLRHLLTGSPHPKKYDWDKYAQAFFPKAEELVAEAEKAEKEGNQEKASEFYLYIASNPTADAGADLSKGEGLQFTEYLGSQRLALRSSDMHGQKARKQPRRALPSESVLRKK